MNHTDANTIREANAAATRAGDLLCGVLLRAPLTATQIDAIEEAKRALDNARDWLDDLTDQAAAAGAHNAAAA